jgi:hyperosmotically inducible protein
MKIANKITIVAALTGLLSLSAMAQPVDSPDLQKKVRHELLMLPYMSVFDNLSYRIDNGVVTLMGEVVRPTLKSDAGNVVKRVEGVKGVINQIEVLPLSPFDDRIRIAAYRAIYGFPALQRYGLGTQPSIRIIVKNGNISLEGVVNNETDRNLANIRANGVPGVFSVSNDLQVVRS